MDDVDRDVMYDYLCTLIPKKPNGGHPPLEFIEMMKIPEMRERIERLAYANLNPNGKWVSKQMGGGLFDDMFKEWGFSKCSQREK